LLTVFAGSGGKIDDLPFEIRHEADAAHCCRSATCARGGASAGPVAQPSLQRTGSPCWCRSRAALRGGETEVMNALTREYESSRHPHSVSDHSQAAIEAATGWCRATP